MNCRQLIKTIAPNHEDGDKEPISPFDLHTDTICSLSRRQLRYMKYAFEKGFFSIAASEVINEYLPEPLPADDDDGVEDIGDECDDEDNVGDDAESINEDDDAGEGSERAD